MARIFAVSDSNHDEQSRSRWGSIEGDRFNSMSWLADQEHRSHVTIISNIHHLGSDTYSSSAPKRESDLLRSLPCGLNFYPFAGSQSASWLQNKSRPTTRWSEDSLLAYIIVRVLWFCDHSIVYVRSICDLTNFGIFNDGLLRSIGRCTSGTGLFPTVSEKNWCTRQGNAWAFFLSGSMGGRRAGVS